MIPRKSRYAYHKNPNVDMNPCGFATAGVGLEGHVELDGAFSFRFVVLSLRGDLADVASINL